jgi:hypothetical protein
VASSSQNDEDAGAASPTQSAWEPKDPDTEKVLVPASKVVPVVGAGISKGAGLPDGADLVRFLCHTYGVTSGELTGVSARDPRKVASFIVRNKSVSVEALRSAVGDFFGQARAQQAATGALTAIASVASGLVITLNYDDSIEARARALGYDVKPYTWAEPPALDDLETYDENLLKVLHWHGVYDRPNPARPPPAPPTPASASAAPQCPVSSK